MIYSPLYVKLSRIVFVIIFIAALLYILANLICQLTIPHHYTVAIILLILMCVAFINLIIVHD